MKSQGFIVDRYLSKVGNKLKQKGVDCKIVDTDDGNVVCNQAVRENRVFLTSNLKQFNKKISLPRGCLHYKANPESK